MFKKSLFGFNKGNTSYKVWSIEVRDTFHDHPEYELFIQHGIEGGSLIEQTELVSEGKQGRSVYEQAVFQAEARIKKKMDANYRETKIELNNLPVLAMLSKDHTKDGKEETIKKGVFTSDKLDGVRCIAKCLAGPTTGEKYVSLFTRTGQPWNVPNISNQLRELMEVGEIFDGELYVHGPSLQEITSAVKRGDAEEKAYKAKAKHEKAVKAGIVEKIEKAEADYKDAMNILDIRNRLEYHIFDIVEFEVPFEERIEMLRILDETIYCAQLTPKIKVLQYKYADSIEELNKQLKNCIYRGFEGIMYRTKDGMYESGKRSTGLWKYKLFFDEEFRIIGVVADKNGLGVFEVLNNVESLVRLPNIRYIGNHAVFNCVIGSHEDRERFIANPRYYIDKGLTVKFQARYKGTLLPQFPTGVNIRDGIWVSGHFEPSE